MKSNNQKHPQLFNLSYADHEGTASSRKQYNLALFNEVSKKYDFITKVLSFNCDKKWKKNLVKWIHIKGEKPICLDLACGSGDITRAVKARFPKGTITGLDISSQMLDLAKKKSDAVLYSQIKWREASMDNLDLKTKSVDLITGGYAIRNAPDLEMTLRECFRILKPGGQALFLDFSRPSSVFGSKLTYFLLNLWGSLWGVLLHKNPEVYNYIAKSLKRFPNRKKLKEKLESIGFDRYKVKTYFFGLIALISVDKTKKQNAF